MNTTTKSYKIIIIGDARVGKTTLRKRFFGEKFESDYITTLGADFAIKQIEHDNKKFVLHFWDFAGQPHYKEVRGNYYRHTSGILMVFDLTDKNSFNNIPNWIDEFKLNCEKNPKNIPIIIIGNKLDLRGDPKYEAIPAQEGMICAKELSLWSNLDVPYYETSALVGLNIDTAFKALVDLINMSILAEK